MFRCVSWKKTVIHRYVRLQQGASLRSLDWKTWVEGPHLHKQISTVIQMQGSWIHTSCIAHFNISSKPPSLPSIHRAVDFISQGAGRSFGPYNLSAPRKGLPVLVQQGTKDHPLPFPLKDPSNPEVYGNRNFLFVTPQPQPRTAACFLAAVAW